MPEEAAATMSPERGAPTSEDFAELNYTNPSVMSKVARKRAYEEERRNRILNAKQRTIGIEKDVLDQQIALKKEYEAAEKEYSRAVDATVLRVDNQLKVLEVERKKMHTEATREVVEFNDVHCKKEDRREYGLSDPKQLKREVALAEEDRGAACMLKFAGEDSVKAARIKAQQAQQRNWIEQQVYEKKLLADAEKEMVAADAAAQRDLLMIRTQVEREENAMRKEVTAAALEYNETKRKEKMEAAGAVRFDRSVAEKIADYREAKHVAADPFLNEAQQQVNSNGRIRRDHFKGLPKEHYLHAAEVQKHQVTLAEDFKNALNEDDRAHDQASEETRRALVALEKERNRVYKETVEAELRTNPQKTLEEIRSMNKVLRNIFFLFSIILILFNRGSSNIYFFSNTYNLLFCICFIFSI